MTLQRIIVWTFTNRMYTYRASIKLLIPLVMLVCILVGFQRYFGRREVTANQVQTDNDAGLTNGFPEGTQYEPSLQRHYLKDSASHMSTPMKPKREKVVILSYYRSGSTLTGDILQHSQDVFYVYEPFWILDKIKEGKLSAEMQTPIGSNITFPFENVKAMEAEQVHLLKSYFDCRFENIGTPILQQWTSEQSKVMNMFLSCTKFNTTDNTITKACAEELSQICLKRRVRVIKLIRANMEQMHTLMSLDPDIKVIHLVRDPRGSLRSQSSLTWDFNLTNIVQVDRYSDKLCSAMMDNLQTSRTLQKHYPGRILTVRYEDIVAAPIEAAQQLYDFLDLHITEEIKKWLWASTYGGNPDQCNICTQRSNATETAYRWRSNRKIFLTIAAEQKKCNKLMTALGYRSLDSAEQMVDSRVNTTLPDFGVKDISRVDLRYPS